MPVRVVYTLQRDLVRLALLASLPSFFLFRPPVAHPEEEEPLQPISAQSESYSLSYTGSRRIGVTV